MSGSRSADAFWTAFGATWGVMSALAIVIVLGQAGKLILAGLKALAVAGLT